MQNDRLKFKKTFERRVYRFALDIIHFIDELSQGQTERIITDQLLRSATSIGANVVEAQASSSRKDYTNFFTYALKSANETKFWLALLKDAGRCNEDKANQVLEEANELASILAASILTLKGRR